jgi:hypothetical protein
VIEAKAFEPAHFGCETGFGLGGIAPENFHIGRVGQGEKAIARAFTGMNPAIG